MEKYLIPVEHLLIEDGLLFLMEQRSKPFVKVIHTECKMFDGNLRMDEDGTVRLRFDEKNGNLGNIPRDTKILWINVAVPVGVSHINFRDYTRAKVKYHAPHVVIITSWKGAYPLRFMSSDVAKMSGKVNHFHVEGDDGAKDSAACIATQKGVIAGTGGVNHDTGYEFTYGHIYGFEN